MEDAVRKVLEVFATVDAEAFVGAYPELAEALKALDEATPKG